MRALPIEAAMDLAALVARRMADVLNLLCRASASRLDQAVEAVPGERIHDQEFIRAVVQDCAVDVTPIRRTRPVRVLLKHETCGGRWPRNHHGIRGSEPDGERRRR